MHNQAGNSEPDAILQLWGLRSAPARGPRARADIHSVAATAVAVADRDGVDAVTLQSVAVELGLTTTALYRYVDSKATLLELMVDAALGAPPVLRARSPRRRVAGWLTTLWQRYESHPWLSTFTVERAPRSPNALGWLDELISELDRAEVVDPLGAALTIDVLVRGYAGLSRVATQAGQPSPELATAIAERFPRLATGQTRAVDIRTELLTAVERIVPDVGQTRRA